MDPTQALKKLIEAIEQQNWKEVKQLTAPEFMYTGPTPDPLNKEGIVELYKHWHKGISNLRFNLQRVHLAGENKASGTINITGKHTGPLDLSEYANNTIQPTNRDIDLPDETVELWMEGDKITALIHDVPEEGGVDALLKQLGVEEPYSG